MSTELSHKTTRDEFVAQNRKFLEDRTKAGQKTLITYVRDEWGFKKGVIVALSPTQIGWSLVHQDKDSYYSRVKPQALPRLQNLQRDIARLELSLLESANEVDTIKRVAEKQSTLIKLLTKFATGNSEIRPAVVKIYHWDREKGLHDAFRRAQGGQFGDYTKKVLVNGESRRVPDVSVDYDVITTLERVAEKLEKFFSPHPKA